MRGEFYIRERNTIVLDVNIFRFSCLKRKRAIVLRAPSTELKAVWQNLLTRQIFIVNSTLGSALNSPLESPDIMISQLSDINLMANSIASIKMSSYESINNRRNQQVSRACFQIGRWKIYTTYFSKISILCPSH